MKHLLIITISSLLLIGCKTIGSAGIAFLKKIESVSGQRVKSSSDLHGGQHDYTFFENSNLSLLPYQSKLAIERLTRRKLIGGHRSAFNNIYQRSKELAIIGVLELLTVKERAHFLRIYDSGTDKNTINRLLASEFKNVGPRRRVTALIREARATPIEGERLIISDFDNTLKPTKDPTVGGDVYPGTVKLLQALDQKYQGDVHIVTARPVLGRGPLKSAKINCNSVSTGNLAGAFGYLVGLYNPIEDRKVKNICKLLTRNPDAKVILIGDDGEADARVYLRIIRDYPDRVEAALIHKVLGKQLPEAFSSSPKVIIYENFEEAASQLHAKGIITSLQMEGIAQEF
jgi:hypothetical protein